MDEWTHRMNVASSACRPDGHTAADAMDLDCQPGRFYLLLKRLIDAVVAFTALVLLSPLLLLIAILVKLDSPGPALFVQERIGYDVRKRARVRFRMHKFRTMAYGADQAQHQAHVRRLIQENTNAAASGGSLKMANDRRITRAGRILRKTSLDELPQLFNVLKGDMSLVGPRPALPYEVEVYEEWHKRRLDAVPGMTGWWQVVGRNRVCFDDMVRLDIYYVRHRSLLLDFKILILTPKAVISGRGAG